MSTPLRLGLAALVFAPVATAQTPILESLGHAPGDSLGRSVDAGGDVDLDGFDDVIVGASGWLRVVSGQGGGAIWVITAGQLGPQTPHNTFGAAVAMAGDVDGDGHADFMAGTWNEDGPTGQDAGRARVFSGKTGQVLYALTGLTAFDHFGRSVAGLGDLDHDGFDDFVVGAELDNSDPGKVGSARVFSGRTGTLMRALFGGGNDFGWAVDCAGDVDADRTSDVIVGSRGNYALVFSGADGSVLVSFDAPVAGFAGVVSGAGDVDGDGFDDVLIGSAANLARVYSGHTGIMLREHVGDGPSDSFGLSLSPLGDIDVDGYADYGIGAPQLANEGRGYARVFSGRTGQVLYELTGNAIADELGYDLAAGDLDQDGLPDLVIGAPGDNSSAVDAGRIVGLSLCPVPVRTFCTSKTNSAGCTPSIASAGVASAANPQGFTVRAHQILENKAGILLYALTLREPGPVPNFFGSHLCVGGPPIKRAALQSSGAAGAPPCRGTFSTDLAALLVQGLAGPGDAVFGQWWYRDSGLPFGAALTDAIHFVVCP